MIITVNQPRYWPYLGYLDRILRSDVFILLDTVSFKIEEFDRRNKIKTPNTPKWCWISVPIKSFHSGDLIVDTLINNSTNWRDKHWRSIEGNYRKSPNFDAYREDIKLIYTTEYEKIIEIQMKTLDFLLDKFFIKTRIVKASDYKTKGVGTDRLIELVKFLGGDTYLCGEGSHHYLDQDKMEKEGINVVYHNFSHPIYSQMYGEFIPNLASFDLLFNHGLDSRDILQRGQMQ